MQAALDYTIPLSEQPEIVEIWASPAGLQAVELLRTQEEQVTRLLDEHPLEQPMTLEQLHQVGATFPEIAEAELHSAELRFAPAALPAAPQHGQRSGHAVSLAIKDEGHVLAVAEQMLARHIPGLA